MDSSKGRKLKSNIVKNVILSFKMSRLPGFVTLIISCVCISVFSKHWYSFFIPFFYFTVQYKELIFEFMIAEHLIGKSMGVFDWFNEIDDGLYLGAIPLLKEHEDIIIKKININAIISIIEPYELLCSTVAGKPIQPQYWKERNIEQIFLHTPDFISPSFQILDKGADYINHQLNNQKKVYVHCKSGKGRSASLIAAYYVKYCRLTPEEAQFKIQSKRKVIFGSNSKQMKNIKEYKVWLRTK